MLPGSWDKAKMNFVWLGERMRSWITGDLDQGLFSSQGRLAKAEAGLASSSKESEGTGWPGRAIAVRREFISLSSAD